eukprot:CAMPEP_0172537322 /NCGR_PEP_ID=MMETSP1067-20121228/8948_1 /TAXON_ID=265564 ORGANISM="Thalassiosira punctigera, Strain Tpunct2005C2" /NCGR_SAMPLE_ID=MMETSP1067 /ASSEMBLY_ACC=CAM_ASM_000444 /LENGTH=43 /DNA_ID= /DNA_START= /DNA_END= /DNA_ORIENTATION=
MPIEDEPRRRSYGLNESTESCNLLSRSLSLMPSSSPMSIWSKS